MHVTLFISVQCDGALLSESLLPSYCVRVCVFCVHVCAETTLTAAAHYRHYY